LLKLTTDGHKALRGLSGITAGLLVHTYDGLINDSSALL